MAYITYDLIAFLKRQRFFSEKTFGPGDRTEGIVDHIRKELREIEDNPADLEEWIDVIILALDATWRLGYSPEEVASVLDLKQAKNMAREWPDWNESPAGKAIEHVRDGSRDSTSFFNWLYHRK